MMFSSDFYDAQTNEFLIDSVLADGQKEFGGYDSIVLWQGYPRLGIDERNQFDMYRQMPGGLDGVRQIVEKCHARSVHVFIDYNPWDTGTRREPKSDYETLADIIKAIDADGVFLDTLSAGSPELRVALDKAKPGLAIVCEGHPEFAQLAVCSGSWGQWLQPTQAPAVLKIRWVEPRHVQYLIRRWDRCRSDEVTSAFFNGTGMLIWENIFGTYNPWNINDRTAWKKANKILHYFSDCFVEGQWQPYYPSNNKDLYINCWKDDDATVYVLVNNGRPINDETLFEVSSNSAGGFYDVWNGESMEPELKRGKALLSGSIKKLGCIVRLEKAVTCPLLKLLRDMKEITANENNSVGSRNFSKSVVHADKVLATELVGRTTSPDGMVFVPGGTVTQQIEHIRGECGCYPDSEEDEAKEEGFGYGLEEGAVYPHVIHEMIKHEIGPVNIKLFFIDEAEVTNAQYKKFLEASGYKPEHAENFLRHWPNGEMPEVLAEHPVVYVDIDDARAYAKWVKKRLPTEAEWQLAAQGLDGRKWPWGDDFDPNKCNTTGTGTLPVRSHPAGKSPYGCYHMSGNVWEWTESCRDDGHTRFIMIRGGSYFNAEGSIWYVKGGPQPCGHHAKFVRYWQGLDRCSTVGFRCVVDAK
jgi:formylglycine-generating enzyme required for sulfatase activity